VQITPLCAAHEAEASLRKPYRTAGPRAQRARTFCGKVTAGSRSGGS
jgi:hypothetical protein